VPTIAVRFRLFGQPHLGKAIPAGEALDSEQIVRQLLDGVHVERFDAVGLEGAHASGSNCAQRHAHDVDDAAARQQLDTRVVDLLHNTTNAGKMLFTMLLKHDLRHDMHA